MRHRNRPRPRNARRLACRPGAEFLEGRIAPSGLPIGVSLDFNSLWAGNPIWTDLHNLAHPWMPDSGTTLALTADGYPLANASTSFNLTNYPAGSYQFSYTGGGTVSFSGAGHLVSTIALSNSVTGGMVSINPANNAWLTMDVTGVSTSNPMDNFHLMMPGYGDGTTPESMFTPQFLSALAPFSNIRFLNWDRVNGSQVTNWSDRVQPNAFLTDSSGGVPYEDMIALCNAAHKDMWINIPALATPDFVQNLAQLISTNLDSGLNVYVEYSNEVWNPGFAAYNQVAGLATSNPLIDPSLSQFQQVADESAYNLVADAQIFDQVFGSAASRVRPILGGWAAGPQYQSDELQFIQQNDGSPSQYIYAQAVAIYFGIPSSDVVNGLTLDQLFQDMNQYFSNTIVPRIQSDAAVDQQYGVPMVAYEGGQALVPGSNSLDMTVMTQAQNDPRMAQLYARFFQAWEQNGGGLFDAYQLSGGPSKFGMWGMLPNVTVDGSVKYDAVLAAAYLPGDANTDGTVNYADFQILQASYGTYGDYWVNGDFNGDGIVNQADLNLFRQSMDPAGFTPSQFAQQAVFGQTATVNTPTALPFDGYANTDATTLTLSSTSGTVNVGQTSTGQPITLGGLSYGSGFGFSGNAATTLTLGGQYTRFDSVIGVDSSSSAASSVIFQVYGDSQLLYQSPTLTNSSAPVPIDVNVAGVQSLKLVVEAANGSSTSHDYAVWAAPQLITPPNNETTFPYALTWQVSQGGNVVMTQTGPSFVLPAVSGTYTLTVTATDTSGNSGSASTTVTVVQDPPSAVPIMRDTFHQGNWMGNYGALGYVLPGLPSALPTYASVSISGAPLQTFASDPNNTSFPQSPGGAASVSSMWRGSTITIDVNLGDGQVHDLALYTYNPLGTSDSEIVQVINPETGAVLDSQMTSTLSGGEYLQWAVTGHVQIVVDGLSQVFVSGLFLDPVSASTNPATGFDATTSGNWIGVYGAQAYDIANGTPSLPSYASVSVAGATTANWSSSTTDPRQPQNPNGNGRLDWAWYGSTSFSINVNLNDSQVHNLSIYAVEGDSQARSEQVQLVSTNTGAVLDSVTLSSFISGVYVTWAVQGNVQIVVTSLSGPNAEISGLFLDQAPNTAPINQASADFLNRNNRTLGNWIGPMGSDGYDIAGVTPALPAYASLSMTGASTVVWDQNTTNTMALEQPGGASRIASAWSGDTMTFNLNINDGLTHDLALYAIDWNAQNRSEQIQITDASTGTVLDTQTISAFAGGVYLNWSVTGDIVIQVTSQSTASAVISGLFLDPIGRPTTAASFVGQDSTTQGNWIGTYGSQGYVLPGVVSNLPAFAQLSVFNGSLKDFSIANTDPRTLQESGTTNRSSSTWLRNDVTTFDLNLTDHLVHQLTLYAADWNSANRSEQIQVVDAATGVVLDSQTLANFTNGDYLSWTVSGHILIQVTNLTTGPNLLISGLFLDAVTPSTSTVNTTFVGKDATTQGNWIGTYGSQGYVLPGVATNLPSYAHLSVSNEYFKNFSIASTDPRTLQESGTTSRSSSTWLKNNYITINLNLTDSQTHKLSLYAADWNSCNRSEKFQLINASTGAVLDTETLANFANGDYLSWMVSGHIIIKVTNLTTGPNLLISGLFLDTASTSVNSASYIGKDSTTQGNWIGTYGSEGYVMPSVASNLPSYASVSVSNAYDKNFSISSTDPRTLQEPGTTNRSSLTWLKNDYISIDLNLTDGQDHKLSLYAADWNSCNRSEKFQLINASTGAVLDTETLANFTNGDYLSWMVSGHIIIKVTNLTTGPNLLLSGLFLDAAS